MDVPADRRYISELTRNSLALVLAGGRGTRLGGLCDYRAKPAVYFGGKFRIIDFPLSNCVNSGIRRIGVLTQYKAHSLIRHLMQGWSHFRPDLGEFLEVFPASQRFGDEWYAGTADAIHQNRDIIRAVDPSHVLVLAGDHVYKMDYGPMIARHVDSGAAMTVGCIEVPLAEASAFGVMRIDDDERVVGFDEKPAAPEPMPGDSDLALASMGIYVFDTEFLLDRLAADATRPESSRDFGRDVIPAIIGECPVQAYPFRDPETGKRAYWRDVGTIDAFWQANMELIGVSPELNLYDHDWPILTYQRQLPPAKFVFDDDDGRRGIAIDSMVSGGCVISGGSLHRSLLFSDVKVNSWSKISDSVLLPDVEVGRYCRVRRAVIDRGCRLPRGTVIGEDPDDDRERFDVTEGGVVLITAAMLGQKPNRATGVAM